MFCKEKVKELVIIIVIGICDSEVELLVLKKDVVLYVEVVIVEDIGKLLVKNVVDML